MHVPLTLNESLFFKHRNIPQSCRSRIIDKQTYIGNARLFPICQRPGDPEQNITAGFGQPMSFEEFSIFPLLR